MLKADAQCTLAFLDSSLLHFAVHRDVHHYAEERRRSTYGKLVLLGQHDGWQLHRAMGEQNHVLHRLRLWPFALIDLHSVHTNVASLSPLIKCIMVSLDLGMKSNRSEFKDKHFFVSNGGKNLTHTSIRIYAYGDFIIELVLRHRDTFYHCEILSSSCALPLCAVCNLFRATSKSSLSVPLDTRRNFSLFAADLSASDSVYI